MERVMLNNDLSLSRLVYGMWRLGDAADTSPAHVQAKIEACLEQGITSMDNADIYGGYMAEEILGQAMRKAPQLRDQIEIVTKCGIIAPAGRHAAASVKHYDTSRAHITQSVEDSLRLMDIEQIDLLLIHRPDPMMDHRDTGAVLDELVASGKVVSVGVSNSKRHDWELLQSAMSNRLVSNQIEMSLIANQAFTNGDLAFMQEKGVVPMAWSPLAGGTLFADGNSALLEAMKAIGEEVGVDAGAVAVAWLLAHPAGIVPLMGTNNLSRIKTISHAFKVQMNRQRWFTLYELANGQEVP
jgi:predicted oxidoreductase